MKNGSYRVDSQDNGSVLSAAYVNENNLTVGLVQKVIRILLTYDDQLRDFDIKQTRTVAMKIFNLISRSSNLLG